MRKSHPILKAYCDKSGTVGFTMGAIPEDKLWVAQHEDHEELKDLLSGFCALDYEGNLFISQLRSIYIGLAQGHPHENDPLAALKTFSDKISEMLSPHVLMPEFGCAAQEKNGTLFFCPLNKNGFPLRGEDAEPIWTPFYKGSMMDEKTEQAFLNSANRHFETAFAPEHFEEK